MSTDKNIIASTFYFLAVIVSIVTARFFFESLSNPYLSSVDIYSLVWAEHFLFFYLSFFLAFVFVLNFFTREPVLVLAKKILPFSAVIVFPPVIDIFITKGQGHLISYFFLPPADLWKNFLTFGLVYFEGISPGIKIMATFVDLALAYYVWKKTANIYKALGCLLFAYVVIFFYDAVFNLVLFSYSGAPPSLPAIGIEKMMKTSWYGMRDSQELFAFFNRFAGMFWWLFFLLQVVLFSFLGMKDKIKIIITNLQWTRSFYYFFIFVMGIRLAGNGGFFTDLLNPFNALTVLVYLLSGLLGVWSAIVFNDFHDEKIDAISNKNRPLVTGKISREDYMLFGVASLLLMFAGLLLVGYAPALCLFFGQALYFLYSAEPFRFKRNFISSSLLTGAAATLVAMSAYFLTLQSQLLRVFPFVTALYLFTIFALIGNIKDIKDYAGDKFSNIKTIPVVFGENMARFIIAWLFVLATLSIPLALKNYYLVVPSLAVAGLFFLLITKNPFNEKRVFALIFSCFLAVIFLL